MAKAGNGHSKYRILSLDGGGIRGIISGQILCNFERILQEKTANPQTRLGDFFDLVAGTSTGGILTCAYLLSDGNGGPKYSAQDAVGLYLEHGQKIFSVPFGHSLLSANGLRDEKYPADGLEEVLDEAFGDKMLSDLRGNCLITSYDIKRRKTLFFSTNNAKNRHGRNFKVRDVARATSAAPTYFECSQIFSDSEVPYALVDGGVFANNPAMCAFAEAHKFEPTIGPSDILMLSLGTGIVKEPYEYEDAKGWGKFEWIKPVIDILMTGVSETVDFQLRQMFKAVGVESQYLRIDPRLGDASPALDDVSDDNLKALKAAGQEAAETDVDKLRGFADLLLAAS